MKHLRRLVIGAVLIFIAFWYLRSPSQDRDWLTQYQQLPQVQISGNRYQIDHIRDFRFNEAGDVTRKRYFSESYDLENLSGLRLGISHFTDIGIAHTLLSFEFTDRAPLVLSVEARMEKGEVYSPLAGLLRNYELAFLLTSEADSIGARLHPRAERVLFYALEVTEEENRNLFKALMQRVAALSKNPEFYNTLTDNCTTSLTRHATRLSWWERSFDYRILLPGYSDELAQELGLLPGDQDIEMLREKALLSQDMAQIEDPDFSQKIRNPQN